MNGKKTWIGLVLMGLGQLAKTAAAVFPEQAPLLDQASALLTGLGATVAGVGAAHKIQKGE
jgi:hypothetical protein